MSDTKQRIKNPTFTQAELDAVDPVLLKGELVMLRDPVTFKVTNFKMGDGFSKWSELPFLDASTYTHADLVTNQIGDILVGSQQLDRSFSDIIKDMISPFVGAAVSNVRTNAAGSAQVTSQLEVGQSISSAISVTYDVSNQSTLIVDPITIDTFGVFTENNPYPVGAISIVPITTLQPNEPKIYTIRVKATHSGGDSAWVSAFIRFDMRMLWGASALADLTTTQHALDLIPSGGSEIKQSFKTTYGIATGGYGYVLIPSLLLNAVPPPVWTDVSDVNAPASIQMVNMGTISVNNGVGTYNYEKIRTPFLNIGSIKLKAS